MHGSASGSGLFAVHDALVSLAANPAELNRARRRFAKAPPSWASSESNNSTLLLSPPVEPDDEKQHRDDPFTSPMPLRNSWTSWRPSEPFRDQIRAQEDRLVHNEGWSEMLLGVSFSKLACDNVKSSWIEQGIWDDEWDDYAMGKNGTVSRSKHELPFELSSWPDNDDTDMDESPSTPTQARPSSSNTNTSRRPRTADKAYRSRHRRIIRARQRESSRPFHQFMYQVQREGEYLRPGFMGNNESGPDDVYDTAYKTVATTWIERGLWNEATKVFPGLSWKYEESPLNAFGEERHYL